MKPKTFLICWLPTFGMMLALNGIFHAEVAANFFDTNFSQLQPVMRKQEDSKPFWVILLDFLLTFGMTYFITIRQVGRISLGQAAFTGGLLNLMACGAWNFVNAALFTWPNIVIVVDLAWHTSLGAAGGILIGVLYNKFQNE